ncbi:MAG: S1/P1 Nuclease [Proteobacteria bacterium]|nr:S1/P1 Nuclease [Pseudomonadota bacterium]
MKRAVSTMVLAAMIAAPASQALAWGDTGHRMVGRLAMEALPADMPAYLRTAASIDAVEELAREPDRWRGAGKTHDSDRDAGHFMDLDDQGHALSGDALDQLPQRRVDFEAKLMAAHTDILKSGYVYYSIIDGWQQLVKDFTYFRVETAALAHEKDARKKAWYAKDLEWRKGLIVRDLGVWAHYVGDGSQPLHLSVHFNGWGKEFANPNGYTLEKIHTAFEGPFVRDHVAIAEARAAMRPYKACEGALEACVSAYLTHTWTGVEPFYQLEKKGGFRDATPEAKAFTAAKLADGASELRDLIVDAWKASENAKAGYHGVTAKDVENGADAWEALYGDG